MSATMVMREDDLRGKIQMVLSKLDKIESRVKNVEAVAAIVPRLEKQISKVELRVAEQLAPPVEKGVRKPLNIPSTPPPVKAFMGGASIGLMIVGVITAAWLLGFF